MPVMTKAKRKACKRCNRPAHARNPLSHNGYCAPCSIAVTQEAALQMKAKSGPFYDAWLATAGPRGGK